jgi:prepilin-type N-terminal cleavage/methylation domain-containing protein
MKMRRGFTLIEMLVVIAIIMILMAVLVAVGSGVRDNANRRNTLAQLKALDGLMKDYLAEGNAEPQPPASWPYTSIDIGTWSPTINPASDPYNWLAAMKTSPTIAKKLGVFKIETDSNWPKTGPDHEIMTDGYGSAIRYVPSTDHAPGYFLSSGPDQRFNKTDMTKVRPGTEPPRPDDLYSYDP